MELDKIKNIYFIGIGGIGMSAIARYFNAIGKNVSGYDKTNTTLTSTLEAEGINIHYKDNIDLIPTELINEIESSLIVYTPAVPIEHKGLKYFRKNNFTIQKRSEVLGIISKPTFTIAVAGTHGKTTTSSLITHIFDVAKLNPSAFLGGITKNFKSNLLLSSKLQEKNNQKDSIVIVEADEYDRSFLTLSPKIGIITSVDSDHLDIYNDSKYLEESYSKFGDLVQDQLIIKSSITDSINKKEGIVTYSINDNTADYYAENIKIINAEYHYDLVTPSAIFKNLCLGLAGLHNVENSVAAIAVACIKNISEGDIRKSLKSFSGVKRRFDYQIKENNIVYIDDYAHHPKELEACINSVKEMYPNKKITGVFQPHLFSRTKDFADEFATSLDLLDSCILMEIYPARELPIEGITSKMLLDKMTIKNKIVCQKENLLNEITKQNIEVILTLGAGDIDTFVKPIKEKLIELY